MFGKYSFLIFLFVFTTTLSLVIGCKGTSEPLGHQGPFDVPTATATITSTPGPVTVTCYVSYNGNQTGLNWNLVDPNGNTINSTAGSTGVTPITFTPMIYGMYSANIPTQTNYLYSIQPINITGSGNYSVTFSCTNQTLSTNPNSVSYSTAIGSQSSVTVSYSYSGNLNVPVSVLTSGLTAAFSVNPTSVILNNTSNSAPLTLTKNSCYTSNISLNLSGYDLSATPINSNPTVAINKGFSVPVSLIVQNAYVNNAGFGTSQYGYTLEVLDSPVNCTSYPVSIFTYPAGNNGSTNYVNSTTVSSQTSFTLNTNDYQNIVFYLTTPDGVVHSTTLLQETNYTSTTTNLGTLTSNTLNINENVANTNNVLISTSY